MRHINYNHLFYFWNVADTGSIIKASKRLYLTPQTISTQVKLLEETTGTKLFEKSGRNLALTEQGKVVKGFADDIFSLGTELSLYMRGGEKKASSELHIGIVETLPKIAVEKLLEPAFDYGAQLQCTEGNLSSLLAELNSHRIDLILSDQSLTDSSASNSYVHFLGGSNLALYAPADIFKNLKDTLPESLDNAPVILPTAASPLRKAAEDWFLQKGITPSVVAECSDSGLIKAMATAGRGMFVAPLNIQQEIEQATDCKMLIQIDGFEERYYAITLDKKIEHPVVSEIADAARATLALV